MNIRKLHRNRLKVLVFETFIEKDVKPSRFKKCTLIDKVRVASHIENSQRLNNQINEYDGNANDNLRTV